MWCIIYNNSLFDVTNTLPVAHFGALTLTYNSNFHRLASPLPLITLRFLEWGGGGVSFFLYVGFHPVKNSGLPLSYFSFHCPDSVTLKPLLCDTCRMWFGIFLLKKDSSSYWARKLNFHTENCRQF